VPGDQPSYIDEHHQRISEFAADYLDDDERDEFVDSLMERHGYQRATHWLPPEPQQGGGKPAAAARGAAGGGAAGGQGGRKSYFKR
jgi:hypothetical protein